VSFLTTLTAVLKVTSAALDLLGRKRLIDAGKAEAAAKANLEALETAQAQGSIVAEARTKDETLSRLDAGRF
jgi:polysaccharide deacetylase 2 family uncharacterized protein YibQ